MTEAMQQIDPSLSEQYLMNEQTISDLLASADSGMFLRPTLADFVLLKWISKDLLYYLIVFYFIDHCKFVVYICVISKMLYT